MEILTFTLGALAIGLALIGFLVPLADRVQLPFPTVVAITGLALGTGSVVTGVTPVSLVLDAYDAWFFSALFLDSQDILFVFLPPLLFEMSLAVNVRRLLEDLPTVILMAVVAVITATAFVGGALYAVSGLGLIACLLLGATISTTDPAAVVTTFRGLGAPRRLLVILEGESLLNDAAAIALFSILLASLTASQEVGPGAVAWGFLYAFGGGSVVGVALGYLAARLYPLLRGSAVAEMSLTVALAYGAFLVAEIGLGASGIVAVVLAGLTTAVVGSIRMGPRNWPRVTAVWGQMGFWANALILLIAALLAPRLLTELQPFELGLLIAVVVGAFAARAVVLFGLLPALNLVVGRTPAMTTAQKTLIWWGGVRGAVTLVLTLSLTETSALSEQERSILGALGCGFVFFTLLVNAGSLAPVTRWLGLDRLSKGDQTLRRRIVAGTMNDALHQVTRIAEEREIDTETLHDLQRRYGARVYQMGMRAGDRQAPFGVRLRLGLTILANQERRIVRRQFEQGVIGPVTTLALRATADGLADATRLDGRDGYEQTMATLLEFPHLFRLALGLQRCVRLSLPLARMLARRFDILFETETVLRELCQFNTDDLPQLIGEDASANLAQLLDKRLALVRQHLEALELQYPHYASKLRNAFLQRAGLRWEEARYDRLFKEGIVGPELHRVLIDGARRLIEASRKMPALDVGLDSQALISAVPLFSELSRRDKRWIKRRLRALLAAPGDSVIRTGERGNEMYFIASGVLEVRGIGEPVRLRTGDFFGELAILGPTRRRNADVVALGFCRLLVLRRRDFSKLLARNAELATHIRAAAELRLGRPLPDADPTQAHRPSLAKAS